jgi:hypothetical protein
MDDDDDDDDDASFVGRRHKRMDRKDCLPMELTDFNGTRDPTDQLITAAQNKTKLQTYF